MRSRTGQENVTDGCYVLTLLQLTSAAGSLKVRIAKEDDQENIRDYQSLHKLLVLKHAIAKAASSDSGFSNTACLCREGDADTAPPRKSTWISRGVIHFLLT